MKTTVYLNEFRDYFNTIRPNTFSYEGLEVLYDYLLEYEDSTGEELDLDVVALCCDYNEGEPQDIANDYGIDTTGEGEPLYIVRDYLAEKTTLLGTTPNGTIIYQTF